MLLATGCKKPEQGAAGLPAPAQTASDKDLVASESGINVRSGPGAEYGVVFKLSANQGVREISRKSETVKVGKFEGQWVNIETNGQTGWVLSAFLVRKGRSVVGKWTGNNEQDYCGDAVLELESDGKFVMTVDWRTSAEPDCGNASQEIAGQWTLKADGPTVVLNYGKLKACLWFNDETGNLLASTDDPGAYEKYGCEEFRNPDGDRVKLVFKR